MDDPRPALLRAADQIAGLVTPDLPLDAPTPCDGLDRRRPARPPTSPSTAGSRTSAAAATRSTSRTSSRGRRRGALRRRSRRRPSPRSRRSGAGDDAVLDREISVPWGTVPGRAAGWGYARELAVHAWDLATALAHHRRPRPRARRRRPRPSCARPSRPSNAAGARPVRPGRRGPRRRRALRPPRRVARSRPVAGAGPGARAEAAPGRHRRRPAHWGPDPTRRHRWTTPPSPPRPRGRSPAGTRWSRRATCPGSRRSSTPTRCSPRRWRTRPTAPATPSSSPSPRPSRCSPTSPITGRSSPRAAGTWSSSSGRGSATGTCTAST